jgi:hypothetical protein
MHTQKRRERKKRDHSHGMILKVLKANLDTVWREGRFQWRARASQLARASTGREEGWKVSGEQTKPPSFAHNVTCFSVQKDNQHIAARQADHQRLLPNQKQKKTKHLIKNKTTKSTKQEKRGYTLQTTLHESQADQITGRTRRQKLSAPRLLWLSQTAPTRTPDPS